MRPAGLVRAGSPPEVTILAVVALVLGVGCLAVAAHPMAEQAPRAEMATFGAAGLAIALVLLAAGPRVTRLSVHAALVLLTGMRGVMVAIAATERGLMLAALGFVWTAVYAAYFFSPAVARWYAMLLTIVLGAGLLLARAPTDASVWVTVSATVWVATALLTGLNARLRAEAERDGLTGLLNRTGFALAAARQRAVSRRRDEPVVIAVMDLDGFKEVNDRAGHAAGDRLLVELAAAWSAALRPSDLLARFGGDEFVLLLPGLSQAQADAVLERLSRAHPAPFTVGMETCGAEESLDGAIAQADRLLYAAKSAARQTRPARQPSLVLGPSAGA